MGRWDRWIGLAGINAVLHLSLREALYPDEFGVTAVIASAGFGALLTVLLEVTPPRRLHLTTVLVCQASLAVLVAFPRLVFSLTVRVMAGLFLPGTAGVIAAGFWLVVAPGCLLALLLSVHRRLKCPAEPELGRAAGQWDGPVSAVLTGTHHRVDDLLVLSAPTGRPVVVRLVNRPAGSRAGERQRHKLGNVVELCGHRPHHFHFTRERLFEVILFGLSPRPGRIASWIRRSVSRLADDWLSLKVGLNL